MRRYVAVGIALLLTIGLIVDRGFDTEPAIGAGSTATTENVSGELPSLGPVELVTNVYSNTVPTLTCLFGLWSAAFSTSDIGVPGTITSSSEGLLLFGTVFVGGSSGFFSCGSGDPAMVITGNIDGGPHTYSVTVTL